MSSFSEYYKKNIFKQSGGQRLAAIDFSINEIVNEMQSKVDPTRWNVLLEQKANLEREREEITAYMGELKMQ